MEWEDVGRADVGEKKVGECQKELLFRSIIDIENMS